MVIVIAGTMNLLEKLFVVIGNTVKEEKQIVLNDQENFMSLEILMEPQDVTNLGKHTMIKKATALVVQVKMVQKMYVGMSTMLNMMLNVQENTHSKTIAEPASQIKMVDTFGT